MNVVRQDGRSNNVERGFGLGLANRLAETDHIVIILEQWSKLIGEPGEKESAARTIGATVVGYTAREEGVACLECLVKA